MDALARMDVWASGAIYETYVGRWSRLVAREFLTWLAVPPNRQWLDVGCGTGALSQTILHMAAPRTVLGVDRSAGFVEHGRSQITDQRVRFEVGDAQALPVESATYDVAVSGLMLNFCPQPQQVVNELARAIRPGGTASIYVWDYAGKMQFMRHFWRAAAALDPAAFDLDEGRRFPFCQPPALQALFQNAGLHAIEVKPIDIATDFRDFDDFWQPFLGGQGSAPGYAMSLSEERRNLLRDRLRDTLPFALDGSIPLVARAWAVRGSR